MKVICPISGLTLYKTPYLVGFNLADTHPIFRAKKKLILNPDMVHKFFKAQSFEEKKLIFLAVLNATDLVEFRRPAEPSLQVVETNFVPLMTTASWLAFAEYTYRSIVSFPQFVVSDETYNLTSLPAWIRSCEDIKQNAIKKDLDRDRSAALVQKELEIKREINEATFFHRAFTPMLARWALDFANLKRTDERYNTWIKIMCSPLSDAWVYELEKIKEIEAFLEEELPCEHPQVISVMAQVRLLILECRKGFTEMAVFNDYDTTGETFTIVEDDEYGNQVTKPSQHLVGVPTSQPSPKDFARKIDYLVAMAKWKLATKQTPKPNNGNAGLSAEDV